MLRMMLRPQWLLALLLALGIAAAFALLGQWQIERAVEQGAVVERPTEDVQPLADVAEPDGPTTQASTGQMVAFDADVVAGDTVLLEGRLHEGEAGYWVVAHAEVAADGTPGGIPLALGWAPDEETASAVAAEVDAGGYDPGRIEGRFVPTEAPELPDEDGDPFAMSTLAVAQLVNVWADYDDRPAYFAYVIVPDAASALGLTEIAAPAPELERELNWLNVFYALEWAVFAGFAIYLWYRLVRDAVEREREEAEPGADTADSEAPPA
ncbi:SURF1 family cytochrome oxidase biogenesis protein [Agromyces mangrovi Wang et al. 2018]|uniref:SURF1 family cytochrome oxidase biogenesis protein n=1 Tax=Agromyces mangrovi TaxID=1858653 RepID=UPI0025732E6F|nr:SURF1 family cytochrome oxidase biogenesis protein [Agromyces mangrovi]BDZ63824.1 hypothetical protein GCM10025877_07620 [Agromyces mangrovi]